MDINENRNTYYNRYISSEEFNKTKEFVSKKGKIIEFEGKYYEVIVETRTYLAEYCKKVTEEELDDCSTLKKAIESANESGRAIMRAPPEEWENTIGFMHDKECIEYNGDNYEVGFITT